VGCRLKLNLQNWLYFDGQKIPRVMAIYPVLQIASLEVVCSRIPFDNTTGNKYRNASSEKSNKKEKTQKNIFNLVINEYKFSRRYHAIPKISLANQWSAIILISRDKFCFEFGARRFNGVASKHIVLLYCVENIHVHIFQFISVRIKYTDPFWKNISLVVIV